MNGYTDSEKNKIEELNKEIQSLKQWQAEMNQLMSSMLDLLEKANNESLRSEIDRLWRFTSINRFRIDSLPYEINDPDHQETVFKPRIMDIHETRKKLAREHMSIARLGDGEFGVISGITRWNFQKESAELAKALRKVLEDEQEGLLIGLNPNFYGDLSHLSEADADGVRAYMRPEVRRFHASLLKREKVYADALFHNMENEEDIKEIKEIWKGRKCLIIEGEHTGSGVGNDLFDEAEDVERILCPAENAFDRYQDILNAAKQVPKDRLVLIALGPTATVLAYDLHKEGYQAIDIGHLDLVYEKYLRNEQSLYKVRIEYKYCSTDEQGERRNIPPISDERYNKQIISKIL